jgi:hypothetical protein
MSMNKGARSRAHGTRDDGARSRAHGARDDGARSRAHGAKWDEHVIMSEALPSRALFTVFM